MCRTIHALLTVVICGVQMLVRVFMTLILMIENVIRMFLQTLYNFISFLLQLISLIPICCVFFATSRLKCFMCGGGGPCPVRRGGGCDCLMSAVAIIILFFIFRATGVLDKIFYSIGYAKAAKHALKYSPTPGTITECSRNDSFVTNATTPQMKHGITGETYSNEMTEAFESPATNTDSETETDTMIIDNIAETNKDIETNVDSTSIGIETFYNATEIISKIRSHGPETLAAADTQKPVVSETSTKTKTTAADTTTKTVKLTTTTIITTTIQPVTSEETSAKTETTAADTTTNIVIPTSILTTTIQSVTSSEEVTTTTTVQTEDRRMGNEKLFGNNDHQVNEKPPINTTNTDEDTIILYYEDDTQISGNNITASKSVANDDSHEAEIEEEDMNSPEHENVKSQVSKISGKVTRSSHYDKNYEKSILKGWLGTTSISYYMV